MTAAVLYPDALGAARPPEALEAALDVIESHLGALGAALRDRNAATIESQSANLHRALVAAIHRFTQASRHAGGVPQALRLRFLQVGGQVAAQRECLARATAALDRAIDMLMPAPQPVTVYGFDGQNTRAASSASAHA